MNSKKRRIQRNREWFKTYKENLECSNCGEDHPSCLEFHHVDKTAKEYKVSAMISNGLSLKTVLKEVAKCIVLCSNCHKKHHWEEKYEKTVSSK